MDCMFIMRRFSAAKEVAVTVNGRGSSLYSYIVIGGTTIVNAGTYTVKTGNVITFAVYGTSRESGSVKIDGTTVLRAESSAIETYDWTVPSDINSIKISMSYRGSGTTRFGTITVTTA